VKNERTEGDVQYFVTCTYCGTQTGLSAKRQDRDKPLKCPKCGAPLKVVPPPAQRRGEPRVKIKREYGYDFTHRPRGDEALDGHSGDVTLTELIWAVIAIVCFSACFIVALVSTC
jgi:DNA-directed RNA polymerase subunit RPC12/RpoP